MKRLTLLAAILVGAMACGGKSTPATTHTTAETGNGSGTGSGSGTGTVVGPPDVKWADMDLDQRKAFMKAKVLPTMQPLFAAYDPTDPDFKNMTCETCHGDGAKDGTFDMPNPKLPKLPNDQDGFMKVVKDHPKAADFMMKTVKPTMAKLLDLPEMDEQHPDGFSCHTCHPAS